ncbi:MAG TPA: hypothetical protein PLS93_02540 [Accumulibacter sp.]|nr:hypothetical protein [Accumulibacter sp.]
MSPSLQEALAPLIPRVGRVVREHEVLRVAAMLHGTDPVRVVDAARQQVLRWAQRRCGGQLPAEAWRCESFDFLSGGRNSSAVRIVTEGADIWAIRADDPDKEVPERVWTTEVVVGLAPGQLPRFSARLLVSTPEPELVIEPHVPGFILQVADNCQLIKSGRLLSSNHWVVSDPSEADELVDFLTLNERSLPVIAVSTAPDVNNGLPLCAPSELARALLGLAVVVEIEPEASWVLTRRFGKLRSVFGGAIRLYRPGFNEEADPYAHRLVIANQLKTEEQRKQHQRWLRQVAAHESVRANPLGRDVLAFSSLRTAGLALRQERVAVAGEDTQAQLEAANATIEALKLDVEEAVKSQKWLSDEHKDAEERARVAENQARTSALRIQLLLEQLKSKGISPDEGIVLPAAWDEFADWCDEHLAGRVVLTSSARRGVRDPEFKDIQVAAQCLLWLANDCRESRLGEGDGSLRDVPVIDGYRNSPCGGDDYQFVWQERRLTADWHIKNNGNTRDPARCLRIYYCWDQETQQIIISDMPAHRRTGAT